LKLDFEKLRRDRAENPDALAKIYAKRKRRSINRGDNKLMIVAADHPARGAMAVGSDPSAMANRYELLERLAIALTQKGVDGVLGTPDIIDDLALLGLLDDKVIVGSMNRGGLRGASFEMDDRFGAYTIEGIKRDGLDFAKTLTRINLSDAGTAVTLEATAKAVDASVAAKVPIMLEPFMSEWVNGGIVNNLSTEQVILSVAIASGLGSSSSYTWLKLPVVEDMDRVMNATTLPTLLLGGDSGKDQTELLKEWESALVLPGVRGLVVGRSLLYPAKGSVEDAIRAAANLVHKN
jgi:DhnA family fructose-bisphosphate aldolase class Ia